MPNAPALIDRSQWQAAKFRGTIRGLGKCTHVVIHHAAGYRASSLAEGKKQLREIQKLHQDKRGWSDVGYHFLIDSAGNVYQGRPFVDKPKAGGIPALAMGAHVKNQNSGKIGVCLLGCFHPPEAHCGDTPTAAALKSATVLAAFLCSSYGVSPKKISGHRDFLSTSCPGDKLYAQIKDIAKKVAEQLGN